VTGGPTHYDLLGVPRGATADEIRRAYRRAVKGAHPDAGGDAERFRLLGEARDTLTDPLRRRDYDRRLGDGPPAPSRTSTEAPTGPPTGTSAPSAPPGADGFTGDVEFPAWLRGVTEAVWERADDDTPAPQVPHVPLAVQWRWPGPVTGRPVATGGDLLVPADDAVVRLHGPTGAVRWRAGLAAPVAVPPVETLGGDGAAVVVVWTADGRLHGLDPDRGTTRWEREVGLPSAPVATRPGMVLLPRVEHRVDAVDPATGRVGWSARVAAGPTSVRFVDAVALVISDDIAEAVELRRGRHRWRERLPVTIDLPPVVVGGVLLLAEASGTLCRMDPATGAIRGGWDVGSAVAGVTTDGQRLLVTTAGPPRLLALTATGRVHWSTDLDEVDPEPAVAGRWGYLLGGSGRLCVADLSTGELRATADTGLVPHGPPVVVATGGATLLVLRDGTGALTAVAAP
jgi:outer membrane protein assembly factor BamB